MPKEVDFRYHEAVKRFQIIAPLLDTGLERAVGRVWRHQICATNGISERTLRRWRQAYQEHGLEGLYPKERRDKGLSRALSRAALELAQTLRKELPARSAERLCELLKSEGHTAKRSTLERHLRQTGYSGRVLKRERSSLSPSSRRFQHEQRNNLWQMDFKHGVQIPDPQKAGHKLQTWLLVILDDATRKVIHAEFYFDQTVHSLMDGMRKAILSAGCPKAVFLDNGSAFTSNWMQLVCARLGIRHITGTPYMPESRGKVERFNRTVEEFMQEIILEQPQTLLALNRRLRVWISEGYNCRNHSALNEGNSSPEEAYAASTAPLRMISLEALKAAFLWEEGRTVDKAGCVQLNGITFDTGRNLFRKKVILRYDPLDLSQVEVFYQGHSQGFAKPLQITADNGVRRKRTPASEAEPTGSSAILQMMSKQEQRRIQSDVGAFILSKEEGDTDV